MECKQILNKRLSVKQLSVTNANKKKKSSIKKSQFVEMNSFTRSQKAVSQRSENPSVQSNTRSRNYLASDEGRFGYNKNGIRLYPDKGGSEYNGNGIRSVSDNDDETPSYWTEKSCEEMNIDITIDAESESESENEDRIKYEEEEEENKDSYPSRHTHTYPVSDYHTSDDNSPQPAVWFCFILIPSIYLLRIT